MAATTTNLALTNFKFYRCLNLAYMQLTQACELAMAFDARVVKRVFMSGGLLSKRSQSPDQTQG